MLLPRSRKLLSSLTESGKITRSSLVTTACLRPDVRLGERNPLKAAESCDDHALASRVMTKCAISAALTDAALGTLIPRRAARGHLASIVDRIRDAIRSDEPTGLRPRNQTRSDGVLCLGTLDVLSRAREHPVTLGPQPGPSGGLARPPSLVVIHLG
jgi:hypothetical protein